MNAVILGVLTTKAVTLAIWIAGFLLCALSIWVAKVLPRQLAQLRFGQIPMSEASLQPSEFSEPVRSDTHRLIHALWRGPPTCLGHHVFSRGFSIHPQSDFIHWDGIESYQR